MSRLPASAPAAHATSYPAPPFRVDVLGDPGAHSVRLRPIGEIDVATVGSLRAAIDECVAGGCQHMVLDLRGVTFLAGAGVHLIRQALADAHTAGWQLLLVQGPPAVQRILDLVGLSDRRHFVHATAR
jgi:anti-anti-sigma factor